MKPRFYWEKPSDLSLDLPGFSKDEITVKIENGMLHLAAEKKTHKIRKGKNFYSEASSSRSFSRSISLPEDVNQKDLEITIKDGLVTLKKKKKKITEKA